MNITPLRPTRRLLGFLASDNDGVNPGEVVANLRCVLFGRAPKAALLENEYLEGI